MKILQINKFHYPRGGAERYALGLSELLEHAEHEVAWFSMRHPKNLPSAQEEYFVSPMEIGKPGLSSVRHAGRFVWSRQAARKLDRLIRAERPDVAHLHNVYHQISPSVLPVLRRHGIPAVMTTHDYKLVCPNFLLYTQGEACMRCNRHKYWNAVRYKCLKDSSLFSTLAAIEMAVHHPILRVYEKHLDAVICPSRFVAGKLAAFKWGGARPEVVPHFVRLPNGRWKNENGVKNRGENGNPFILYMGRLSQEKGVDFLYDLMYSIESNVGLKIAGSGPLKAALQERFADTDMEDRVQFLGHLDQEELTATIRSSFVVVVPSRSWETFGLAAAEAAAHGTPVVAFRSGALPEVVDHAHTGLVVEAGNVRAMARAVDRLVSRPELAARMGEAARKKVERDFDTDGHVSRIISIYASLVEKAGTSNRDRSA